MTKIIPLDTVRSAVGKESSKFLRIVCISDTHGKHRDVSLPKGDVLIHAGDFTYFGDPRHQKDFDDYLGELAFKYKLVVRGNHDVNWGKKFSCFCCSCNSCSFKNGILLENDMVEIESVKFFGTSYRNSTNVPEGIDILITHRPPRGFFDMTRTRCRGDILLREAVERIKPKIHVFGHVHEHQNWELHTYSQSSEEERHGIFINASSLVSRTLGVRKHPIVLDYPI